MEYVNIHKRKYEKYIIKQGGVEVFQSCMQFEYAGMHIAHKTPGGVLRIFTQTLNINPRFAQ